MVNGLERVNRLEQTLGVGKTGIGVKLRPTVAGGRLALLDIGTPQTAHEALDGWLRQTAHKQLRVIAHKPLVPHEFVDISLFRMQTKSQLVTRETRNSNFNPFQMPPRGVDNQKVIHVAQVIGFAQAMFYKLVEVVKINVGEQLAGQITDGLALRNSVI